MRVRRDVYDSCEAVRGRLAAAWREVHARAHAAGAGTGEGTVPARCGELGRLVSDLRWAACGELAWRGAAAASAKATCAAATAAWAFGGPGAAIGAPLTGRRRRSGGGGVRGVGAAGGHPLRSLFQGLVAANLLALAGRLGPPLLRRLEPRLRLRLRLPFEPRELEPACGWARLALATAPVAALAIKARPPLQPRAPRPNRPPGRA
eukprot:tig00021014_g17094.t1